MRRIVVVVVLVLAGCGSTSKTVAPATIAEPTTTTAAVAAPAVIPPGCTPARADVVAAIDKELRHEGRLGEAFAATDGGLYFVAANVHRSSQVDHGEVWVVTRGKVYSLTAGANDMSYFEDGRDLRGNPSAGDDIPQTAIACAVEAVRTVS